jgi:predicted nuclease of predicted toxin-antitoxin system
MPPVSSTPTWRFLVDDNLPDTLIAALQAAGWQAEHTQSGGRRGRPDREIFAYAQSHQALIVTQDHDLADRQRFPPPHAGIVVVPLPKHWPRPQKEQRVVQALRGLRGASLSDTLVLIEPSQVLTYR